MSDEHPLSLPSSGQGRRHRRTAVGHDDEIPAPTMEPSSKGAEKPHRRSIWQHFELMLVNRRWGALLFTAVILCTALGVLSHAWKIWHKPSPLMKKSAIKADSKRFALNKHQIVVKREPQKIDRSYGQIPLLGAVRSDTKGKFAYYPYMDLSNAIHREEAIKFSGLRTGFQDDDNVVMGSVNDESTIHHVLKDYMVSQKGRESAKYPPHLAVLTRRGYKGGSPNFQINQDRIGIHTSFGTGDDKDFFMGLFDGHGNQGHVAAHYALLEMPKRLEDNLFKASGNELLIRKALVDVFLDIDKTLPQMEGSGCTGHTITRLGDTLYIANAGDSRTMIVSHIPSLNETSILYRNVLHKPDMPEERKRIESMGGTVLMPPPNFRLGTARVLVTLADGFTQLGLAMSRSLGDHEAQKFGVIAIPSVDVLHIGEILEKIQTNHPAVDMSKILLFAVTGSDGIMDLVKEKQIVETLATSLVGSSSTELLEACESLILTASREWTTMGQPYRDDISLAAIEIKI